MLWHFKPGGQTRPEKKRNFMPGAVYYVTTMRNNIGLLKILGFITAAVIVGIGLGWLASRPKTIAPKTVTVSEPLPPPTAKSHLPEIARQPAEEPAAAPAAAMTANPSAAMAATEDWGDKISDILTSDTDFPEKCKDMLALYPDLPDDGKLEVAQHLNNLIADEDYAPLGKILIDPKTPAAVGESLLNDLFNRPDSLKIPLMLQVARTPGHPNAAAARENLADFLEEDHGTDWAAWEKTATAWLKANPD